ncbi:MAG: SDR family NAD(P)-dependent oxidoreductase [Candidatus Limnocylindria bacterium]|jgi:3-oxoacyl-[acyl-carrier protein] reductase
MQLSNRTAFVTGAGSGLGREIALAFAREGARVMATDVNAESAAETAAACAAATAGAESCRCDVSDSRSVTQAFARLDEALGALDVLVNNAGIIHTDPAYVEHVTHTQTAQVLEVMTQGRVSTHWGAIERLSDEMFDRMLRVHLYGTFYCTREALPRMRESGRGGRIINMGSIMGTASLAGAPDYCAAKGAILAFTRATAREAASYGVLVNAIAPGFIETPLLAPISADSKRLIAAQTPLGRLGEPADVAAVAVFLAGPGGAFLTGQTISPNGGIYMSQ